MHEMCGRGATPAFLDGGRLHSLTAQRDKRLAANLWLAVAYLAAAWLSLLLAARPGDPSPLSLTAGIGVAALYSGGWRMLPGLALATFLAAFLPSFPGAPITGPPAALPALVLALAPLVQAALGAALFRQLVDPAVASGRSVLRFLLLTPLICCVRASLAVAALRAIGNVQGQLPMYWLGWWMGDAIGVLLGAPLCWTAIGRPRPLWRPRRLLVALPLVLAATAFIAIYQQALRWEREQQLETFRLKAQEVGQMMQAALNEHERFIAGVARAIDVPGAPLHSDPARWLDPDNFYEVARNYLNQRPELLAMAWLPRVSAAQRPALEAWASAHYGRHYAILDVSDDGAIRPAGPRPEYYPSLLVEPPRRELLLGRDFLSEPGRAQALGEAIRTRRPSASPPVKLRASGTTGIQLLQAVLSDGPRSAPAGMLNLVLRVDTYLGGIVNQSGFQHFVVAFVDSTDPAAPVRLIDNIDRAQHLPEQRRELHFGGRRYLLRLAPDAAYLSAHSGWQSWSVLTGGLLLTGLMGALLLVISGERTRIQAQVDDSTARLREREARLQAILDNAADAIITIDRHGAVLSTNPAAGRLFGYAFERLPGVRVERLLALPDEEPVAALRRLAQSAAGPCELAGVNSAGDTFPLSISASQVALHNENIFVCIIHDLTEQRRAQAHIYQLAHHDALTGLENRFSLNQRLDLLLAQARRAGHSVALLFLDLDHFKKINDSEGHQTGDLLLAEVAHRLKELMRDVDIIARLGGDEFIVVMAGALTPELVSAVAVRIVQSLGAPYQLDSKTLHSGASVGIAMFPGDAPNAGILLRHADTAMYVAKSQGRGNFQFFSPAMNAATHERLVMENRIWNALSQRQFELYLQPQVALGNGRVVGAEALLRWTHPELGMIEPDRVIPIAEESGLILALGDWVLERAVELLAEWKRDGLGDLRMAVNLSARQFRGRELLPRLEWLLGSAGIAATQLELEITESAAMHDPEQTRYLLRQLRERGIQVAIDDFGTGYSSLNYLKLFAIDRIKIDRTFVTDIETDPNDAAIVTATIGLAHAMGLTVVAEGVETVAQSTFLRSRACDEAQGYLFARPMPSAQFREFMARESSQRALVP